MKEEAFTATSPTGLLLNTERKEKLHYLLLLPLPPCIQTWLHFAGWTPIYLLVPPNLYLQVAGCACNLAQFFSLPNCHRRIRADGAWRRAPPAAAVCRRCDMTLFRHLGLQHGTRRAGRRAGGAAGRRGDEPATHCCALGACGGYRHFALATACSARREEEPLPTCRNAGFAHCTLIRRRLAVTIAGTVFHHKTQARAVAAHTVLLAARLAYRFVTFFAFHA